MKTAVIFGGTSGIGYGIARILCKDHNTYILGRTDHYDLGCHPNVTYMKYDALSQDIPMIDADEIYITMGTGGLDYFEENTLEYIDRVIDLNCKVPIKIIKHYYDKIKSGETKCCIITSICGFVSSPLYSVYSASKAGLRYFIEGVNIELGKNKILNVAPGYIEGTSFRGDLTEFDKIKPLCKTIISELCNNNDLYIPEYDNVYKDVINRYIDDFRKFGEESLRYKLRKK